MAQAEGEQILVSDILKTVLGAAKDLGFRGHKRVRLKGFPERWRLWEVIWRSERIIGQQGRSYLPRRALVTGARRMSAGRRNARCCARRWSAPWPEPAASR